MPVAETATRTVLTLKERPHVPLEAEVLTPDVVAAWPAEPVALVIDHPAYRHEATLGDRTKAELLGDLVHGG